LNISLSNTLKVLVSITIGVIFLWLALRSVDIEEVTRLGSEIEAGWIFPFVIITILSFWFRMERWKLLTEHDHVRCSRRVLFAGVMNGYAVNYAVPRLGEITRCYYVAKKEDKPVAVIIGTVVLERIIDVVVLLFLMAVVVVFIFTDTNTLANLLGFTSQEALTQLYVRLALIAFTGIVLLMLVWLRLGKVANKNEKVANFRNRLITTLSHFKDGLFSIRTIKNPVRFLMLTVGLWMAYIIMAWLPFSMIAGSEMAQLGLLDGLVITVISAIGVTIPSPGGIGTYHLFVQKSMNLLYGVPESAGFTYALISHGLVLVIVLIVTPVALYIVKRRSNTANRQV